MVSSWDKFTLLLWKNWTLQWAHKWALLIELLLPAVFALLLVLVRTLVTATHEDTVFYTPQNISNLDLYRSQNVTNDVYHRVKFALMYSPENPLLGQIVQDAADRLNFTEVVAHKNAVELEQALVLSGNYFAGVQFPDDWATIKDGEYPMNFDFTLRFPSELRTSNAFLAITWYTRMLFPLFTINGPRNPTAHDGGIPSGYLREGFIPLQSALSSAYLKRASGADSLPEVVMQRYPYPEYIDDPLIEALASLLFLIIMLSFIYPGTVIAKYIAMEKEKQLKEVMKIMGLNNWLHWAAWFIKAFVMLAISSLLIVAIMKIRWVDDVAVLSNASFTALYVFFLVYIIASICFCFMIAVFFSKASTAAAVTGLFWFIASIPYSFNIQNYGELTLGQKMGWCLISNSAIGFGTKLILDLEGSGEGLQWSNMFRAVSVEDPLSVGYIMLMMLAGAVMYMIVCLYIEQIYPGEFGVPRKWYFPVTREFWFSDRAYDGVEDISSSDVHKRALENPNAFEAEPVGKHAGLQVKNLGKRFGDKVAVQGLTINMYQDEITVLLGHNGAGKTTTISMLTGMFPPTSGTATINGSDIRTNITGARMSLGICPQHNVLFDDMSVANHIVFFCRLKGLKGAAIQKEVDKYLSMIELQDKANEPSSKLSGGMKRKLAVCCALCGDTKVVLCDEPSSGMDPSARRQLWDLLQSEKIGRTLLLTTHFMDEADVLGDRIAIMSGGELKCHGTSFFLKKKFGIGYYLICVKRDNCDTKEVTELLSRYIPGIQPEADIGTELSYQLPDNYSSRFEQMFADLEENTEALNLGGYGVGITSLEEVFMKVGAEKVGVRNNAKDNGFINYGHVSDDKMTVSHMNGSSGSEPDIESIRSDGAFASNVSLLKGSTLALNQWHAMFLKKIMNTFRNIILLLVQNIMPIFFVMVTIFIARNQGAFVPLPAIRIQLPQYPNAVTVLERSATIQTQSLEERVAASYESLANSYGPSFTFETTGDVNFTTYILKLGETIQPRINTRYLAAASVTDGQITAWLNNEPFHTAPLTVNMVYSAMARALLGDSASISVTNFPLPYTQATIFNQLSSGNNLGTQMATNLCFCMCFVSAIYILFLIKERESRSKLLQFVGGVNVWTFWLTQFLWDFATYVVTAVIVIVTIACFQEAGFSSFEDLSRYFVLLLMFGFAVLPFTYLFSLMFREPATGFARISILNIFAGMALFIVVAVMSIEVFNTKDAADILKMIFLIFPHFALATGLNQMYTNIITHETCATVTSVLPESWLCTINPSNACCHMAGFFGWKEPGVLVQIVYLVIVALICFAIIIMLEYRVFAEIKYKLENRRNPVAPPSDNEFVDDDVAREKQRIAAMSSYERTNQNLVLDRVSKYYGPFLAVNNVSLCVNHNECFGLLGVNGAGKTTTFKMMTGDERISSGAAYVKGLNLASNMNKIYRDIGYCPQFDALLDDLTGRETLLIFCLIRGIPRKNIKRISEELAKSFGFAKHLDKPTKAYSGGNKRKLSTAIAVIGSPSVIYLDEPTSGMDPAARRQLWNMVCRLRDSGKSIVLTSHSMEECEALCSRLAIMVNGEFKCLGSTQHLKNKFSKGLVLKIKVKRNQDSEGSRFNIQAGLRPNERMEQDIANIKDFVQREFPDSVLQEEYQSLLTYYVPLAGVKWSVMFGLMERNRDPLNIEDYSISQTTLEEIFLEFAKYQREDSRKTKKNTSCCGAFESLLPNQIEAEEDGRSQIV